MSRFDYTDLLATSRDLIFEFGAPATAIISGEADVTSKSWRGEDTAGDIPVDIEMAVVDFENDQVDGDRILRTDKLGLVSPPATGEDLTKVSFIEQDNIRYAAEVIDTVRPATTTMLYQFRLRR